MSTQQSREQVERAVRRRRSAHGACFLWLALALGSSFDVTAQSEPPRLAAYDLTQLDVTADPCENFYQHACGGWHAANPRPADESFWSRPFTQYARKLQAWIAERITRIPEEQPGDSSARRVASYWGSCIADDGTLGRRALALDLDRIAGLRSLDQFSSLVAALHGSLPYVPRAEPLFYLAAVDSPWAGREEVALNIGPSGLGLPRALYDGEPEDLARRLSAYERHIERTFARLGGAAAPYMGSAGAVVAFEVKLASARRPIGQGSASHPEEERGMPWDDFRAALPSLDWNVVLRASGIPRVGRVRVREPDYFRRLGEILRATPPSTLRAYLAWTVTNARIDELGTEFAREAFEGLDAEIYGAEEAPSRERVCMDALQRDLPDDLGRMFAADAFDPTTGQRAEALFENIRGVVRKRLASLDWMAEATRREALAKVDEVRIQIGVPDRWLTDDYLVIRDDDFSGNVRRAGASRRRIAFSRIGSPSDGNWWDEPATWVGGFYLRRSNAIVVTAAGLLMTGAAETDLAGLYGNLGTFLAHELMHAFDPGGSRFDARGRFRLWWTPSDAETFAAQGQCLADHFSTYEYTEGVPVVGEYVLNEQVAELTAWSIAWTAYLAAVDEAVGSRSAVDAARPDRSFFIAAAQSWCSEATDAEWRRRASGGSYKAWAAPMVHGTVRHVPEFAAIFGCGENDAMVLPPNEVCRIW